MNRTYLEDLIEESIYIGVLLLLYSKALVLSWTNGRR